MPKINSSVLCLSAWLTVSFAQNVDKIVVQSSNGVDIAVHKSGAGPALLLVHGSAKDLREGAAFVCNSLAACEVVALEGQGHVVHKAAPDLFAGTILKVTGRISPK